MLSVVAPSTQNIDLTPIEPQASSIFTIGKVNDPVDLLQFYDLDISSAHLVQFFIEQTSGPSFETELEVVSSIIISKNVTDSTLNGKNATFKISATTNLIE